MMISPGKLIDFATLFGLDESAAMKEQRLDIWSEPRDDAKITQAISHYQALGQACVDSASDVRRPCAQIGLMLLSAAIRSRLAETGARYREQMISDISDAIAYADSLPELRPILRQAITRIIFIDLSAEGASPASSRA